MSRCASRLTCVVASGMMGMCAAGQPAPAAPWWAEPEALEAAGARPSDDGPEAAARPRLEAITLFWDNDGAYSKPFDRTDRHYTNGLRAEVAWRWPSVPEPVRPMVYVAGYETEPVFAAGLAFGQLIFTPEDLASFELIEDDRPYAGWLFGGAFVQLGGEHTMDHLELDVGVVGELSAAESTQKFVHAVFPNNIRPNGWSHQLANEPAANLSYVRRWRTATTPFAGLDLQAIPELGAEVGTVRINASAAVTLRLGHNLPDDFGPARLQQFRDHTGSWPGQWGAYAYVRLGGRVVGRDLFLDGSTFSTGHSVDKEPLVGELTVGLVARWRALELGYAITWSTPEFTEQDEIDSFGALVITIRTSF